MLILATVIVVVASAVFGIALDKLLEKKFKSRIFRRSVLVVSGFIIIAGTIYITRWNNPSFEFAFERIPQVPGSSEFEYGEGYALDINNTGNVAITDIKIKVNWAGYRLAQMGISGQLPECNECASTNMPTPFQPVACTLKYINPKGTVQLVITGIRTPKDAAQVPELKIEALNAVGRRVTFANLSSAKRSTLR